VSMPSAGCWLWRRLASELLLSHHGPLKMAAQFAWALPWQPHPLGRAHAAPARQGQWTEQPKLTERHSRTQSSQGPRSAGQAGLVQRQRSAGCFDSAPAPLVGDLLKPLLGQAVREMRSRRIPLAPELLWEWVARDHVQHSRLRHVDRDIDQPHRARPSCWCPPTRMHGASQSMRSNPSSRPPRPCMGSSRRALAARLGDPVPE
jgi:hypothetical protein